MTDPAQDVVVLSAVRTPIGRFLGTLSALPAVDLGVAASRAAMERAGVRPADVGLTVFGMARQAGARPNPARQVSVRAGVPEEAPAFTVNQACASGMASLQLAADALRAGRAEVVLAGGMESMSQVPHALMRMRNGYRLGADAVEDLMYRDGFHCPLADQLMGETAETLARERGITREEQDRFALESQRKAAAAWEAGAFDAEVVPVEVPGRRGEVVVFERDEHPRPTTTMESLAKLPPVFDREHGTVTAGNASGITDGAAALVLTTAANARRLGARPMARLLAAEVAGCDPRRMGLGPVPATRALLQRRGWSLDDFDLFELNEAFAAQVLACLQELPIPEDRLDVHGGAIALGHPIGCTGARIVVTLLHALARRGEERGLATLCVSGGMGMTTAWEVLDAPAFA